MSAPTPDASRRRPAQQFSLRYRLIRKIGFLLRLRLESEPGPAWRAAMALLAWLMRLHGWTLRMQMIDPARYVTGAFDAPAIFLLWHNRIFSAPSLARRYVPRHAPKKYVLTSAGPEGALLTLVVRHFGFGAVRGSSSRRGAAALRALETCIARGHDLIITPDGPRGPRYRLQPGALALAQRTGRPIVPIHVEYSSAWRFKTWDGFAVARPFSAVRCTVGEPFRVNAHATPDELEAARQQLERIMVDALIMDGRHSMATVPAS